MRQAVGRWRTAVWVGIMVLGWFIVAASAIPRATLAQQTDSKTKQQESMIVRIRVETAKQQSVLTAEGIDLLEMRDGKDLFAMVSAKELANLRAAGFDVRIDADQTTQMRSKAGTNVVQGGYRTVEEGYALLNSWQSSYPNLAQTFTYGTSWDKKTAGGPAGYDLRGITLTNKLIPGPKPTFVLISAIHAREMSTAELSLRFGEYLVSRYATDPDVAWLLNEHQVVIMPFVNPDGRKDAENGIYQRKNKNTVTAPCSSQNSSSQPGIDLNRNSHFYWGTVDTPSQAKCSATYPGPSVASEPEVSSLEAWISRIFIDQRGPNDNDPAPTTARDIFITLHSYSDLVLWPYGWGDAVAPNDADLAGLGRKFASYNGYTAEKSSTLYPTSGATDDWTYGQFGVASYTFEVGGSSGTCGGFMPAFSCMDGGSNGNFWGRNLPALLYAAKVARTPYLLHRGPDALSPAIASVSGGYRLSASINDTKNGNQAISGAELYLDTPPWRGGTPIALTATDGTFNSTSESVQGTISGASAGRHLVYLRGKDSAGNWGATSAAWLDATAGGSGTLSGRVTTADNGVAAAGVTVSATAGSTTATAISDANGNYTFALAAGSYSVSASGANYLTTSATNQTVAANQTTSYQISIVEKARLTVNPTAITLATAQGGSTSQALTVGNAGGQALAATVSVAPADYDAASTDTAGGPTYSWVEINSLGTRRALADDACAVITLPQAFSLYGTAYTSIGLHSNGFLTLGSANCAASDNTSSNPTLPSSATPNGLIAALWDDLDPSATSGANGVFTYHDATNGRFIVEFKNVPHWASGGSANPESFQFILSYGSGDVTLQYQTVAAAGGATVGIENSAGNGGVLWSYNDATKLRSSLALRFQYFGSGAGWLGFTPSSLNVAARSSAAAQVTATSGTLAKGRYRARLKVDAGTAVNGVQYVPVTFDIQ